MPTNVQQIIQLIAHYAAHQENLEVMMTGKQTLWTAQLVNLNFA